MNALPPPLLRAALWRALALAGWALVLAQSAASGRLYLLLRAAFHPIVWIAALLLLLLAIWQGALALRPRSPASVERGRRPEALMLLTTIGVVTALLAVPPEPSFADLASRRPRDQTTEAELSFVLPPAQRSLTDWVRLIRSQPDPRLFEGDAVRISGFVLPMADGPPQLARLLVRCCLADATPVGLPVRWPTDRPVPPADQWLSIEGVMERQPDPRDPGADELVVVPSRVQPIPRPARPLEP